MDAAPAETKSKVSEVLTTQLRLGKASMASVARAMSISEATLRRRLGQEGTSFSQVVEEVRFALARRYLEDPTLEVLEVAQLLGFREPGGFIQVFERWSGGVSPAAFRGGQPVRAITH
jgi:AraC-like DNA-binding protein